MRSAAVLFSVLLASGAGCRSSSQPSGAAATVHRYTVRAQVVTLPAAGANDRRIALRHESIPDFADRDGKVVGMGAMIMPFDLAPGVAFDGLHEGDPVEVTFAVDWSGPTLRVERLQKLPPGTPLQFDN